MCRKKNLTSLAIVLTLLFFTLAAGASAQRLSGKVAYMHDRLPRASEIPTPYVLVYEYPYATSAEALDAIKTWNEVTIPEYYAKLDEWKVQYEVVLAKAERIAGAPDGDDHFVLGPYWHQTQLKYCITWFNRKGVPRDDYPEYEVPAPPEFDVEPYEKAISACCYLMSDGLSKTDWSYLKCVLCWFDPIRRKAPSSMDTQGNDEKLVKMRDEGYVTVTEAQTDLAFTTEGFAHFKSLVERLAEFRAANIAIAAEKGAVTAAEAKKLNEANDKIKAASLTQLDTLQAGPGKAKKSGGFGKLFGKKGKGDDADWDGKVPESLREDVALFEVDKKGSALHDPPYRRVLESLPVPDISLHGYFFTTSGGPAKPIEKWQALSKYLDLGTYY